MSHRKRRKPLLEATLRKMETACEKAHSGPWEVESRFIYEDFYEVILVLGKKGSEQETMPLEGITYATAEFIADSRCWIPQLLQEIRALRQAAED